MTKTLESLLEADERQTNLEKKKLDIKHEAIRIKREQVWIGMIWSIGIILILLLLIYGRAHSWFF